MAIYFADTSFWVALVDSRVAYHAKAFDWSLKISGSIVTANTFCKPNWRPKVIALIDHIVHRGDIEVVYKTWHRGWQLFTERSDKSWSLTDCISFEVMRERGPTDALAADSHFRQAGYRALLLDPQ